MAKSSRCPRDFSFLLDTSKRGTFYDVVRYSPLALMFIVGSCSNSASNTTPAGLMLSAMNGSDHTHTSLGEIKQEDAMRMVDSPLRDVNEQ